MTLIDQKHQELGGAGGFLGRPRGPEGNTPDGRGHFRHFEGGSIYVSLGTDAHEVHGAIRGKWEELEWERGFLGYPVTDETPTPDGRGRFNPFEGGSIYWTPETGARVQEGTQPVVCSISGRAYGPGAQQARVFGVSLYGPNDPNAHRETRPFDSSGRYAFTELPPGRYRLTVDTKAEVSVGPHPPLRDVDCRGGEEKGMDFELR